MAKLIFLGEKFAGRVYEFAVEKTTVGRGDHNTLTIHDASVSHSHCEILVYGTEVIVRDLGSSNGTVVDGKRLHATEQRPLDNGQIVKFGSVEACLNLSLEADSDTVSGWTAVHSHVRHVGNTPNPATALTNKLEGASQPAKDEHTLIISPAAGADEARMAAEPLAKVANGRASGKVSLVLLAVAIGGVLGILCWLVLAKSG